MKYFIQLIASIVGFLGVGYIMFFTSFGRSDNVTSTVRLSDSIVITSDTAFYLFGGLLLIICLLAIVASLFKIFSQNESWLQ